MARAATRPNVAGVGILHPERIVFPALGATKLDLARYYEAMPRGCCLTWPTGR